MQQINDENCVSVESPLVFGGGPLSTDLSLHDDTVRDTVYVGLYTASGGKLITNYLEIRYLKSMNGSMNPNSSFVHIRVCFSNPCTHLQLLSGNGLDTVV